MANLAKLATAFPRALGVRVVLDPWDMGFRVTVRRADNKSWTDWLAKHVDSNEVATAMLKATLKVQQRVDWRRPPSRDDFQDRVADAMQVETSGVSFREQAPGVREHLVARDASGPLAWLDDERLTEADLEALTTISTEADGAVSRWLPEDRPLGGRAFEEAFAMWVYREAADLAAFEERHLETDLGKSGSGAGGGTAPISSSPSATADESATTSAPAPGDASQGAV